MYVLTPRHLDALRLLADHDPTGGPAAELPAASPETWTTLYELRTLGMVRRVGDGWVITDAGRQTLSRRS